MKYFITCRGKKNKKLNTLKALNSDMHVYSNLLCSILYLSQCNSPK